MVDRSPPEREIVNKNHSQVRSRHEKIMAVDMIYSAKAASLRAISINQRGGCLVGGGCLEPPTQDPR